MRLELVYGTAEVTQNMEDIHLDISVGKSSPYAFEQAAARIADGNLQVQPEILQCLHGQFPCLALSVVHVQHKVNVSGLNIDSCKHRVIAGIEQLVVRALMDALQGNRPCNLPCESSCSCQELADIADGSIGFLAIHTGQNTLYAFQRGMGIQCQRQDCPVYIFGSDHDAMAGIFRHILEFVFQCRESSDISINRLA